MNGFFIVRNFMRSPFLKKQLLVQTVLTSSIFMAPLVQADNCTVTSVREEKLHTSSCGNNQITITQTGQLKYPVPLGHLEAVVSLDTKGGQVNIEDNNAFFSVGTVKNTYGTYNTGGGIIITGENGVLTIGNRSSVVVDNQYYAYGIYVSQTGTGAKIINRGQISSPPTMGILVDGAGLILENEGTSRGRVSIQAPFKYVTNNGTLDSFNVMQTLYIGGSGGDKETIAVHNKGNINIDYGAGDEGAGAIVIGRGSWLGVAGGVPGILNEGTIRAGRGLAIRTDSGGVLGGLVNKGNIIGNGNAIDFHLSDGAPFRQEAGTVTGHVWLAKADGYGQGKVFTLAGGSITGNVIAANVKDRTAYIHQLSGGDLVGILRGSWWGDTFNQSGGYIGTYQGAAESGNTDTFNITGGSFGTLRATTSQTKSNTTAVNFNHDYILNGTIVGSEGNTLNINVNPGAHLTTNAVISDLSGALKVYQDASLEPNSRIRTIGAGRIENEGLIKVSNVIPLFDLSAGTGAFSNEGILELGSSSILSINGGNTADIFRNEAGSYLNIDINGDKSGQIMVDSKAGEAVLLSDLSSIKPVVTGDLTGTRFNIITVIGGGQINDVGAEVINGPDMSFSTRLIEGNTILQLFTGGDCTINEHRKDLLQTSLCPGSTITVESTGQIQNKEKSSAVLLLDNDTGKIVIDADNTKYGAGAVLATRNSTLTPTIGIHITSESKSGAVTIGENSGISAESSIDHSHALVIEGSAATITNAGLIQLNSAGENIDASAIYIAEKGSATLNNRGEISNNENYNSPVISASTNAVFKLENGGKILTSNYSHPTIHSDNAQLISIINTAEIANNGGGEAIDLSSAMKGELIQKGGEIKGHVSLAQTDSAGGGHVFTLEAGDILGDVIAADIRANTFTLTGGHLRGTLTGGNKGDTFNQSEGTIEFYQGNAGTDNQDTFNITGGDFTVLETSNDKGSYTEINFMPTHEYIVGNISGNGSELSINVGDGITKDITVIANKPILGLNGALIAHKESTFVPNSTIATKGAGRIDNQGLMQVSKAVVFDLSSGTGVFSNAATLELGSSGVLNIKGSAENIFKNEDGSYLNIKITDSSHGQIKLNSTAKEAVLLSDLSSINPIVTGELTGKEFDIITVTGGGKINDAGVQIINDRPDLSFSTRLMKDNTILQLFLDDAPTDCIVNTHRVDLLQTSLCPDFTITVESTGQIENKDKKSAVLLLDNDAGKIVIDADNSKYGAKAVLATLNSVAIPTVGIHITSESKGGDVRIGAGSGISAESSIERSHALVVEGTAATITNAGLIQLNSAAKNINANAIYIAEKGSATVNNRGEISNNGNYTTPLITVASGGQLLGAAGLTNSGTIIHNAAKATAIDLSQAVKGAFLQQKGEIRGDVFLAQGDGEGKNHVFALAGGSITGNVTAADKQAYIYALSGGELNGIFTGSTRGDVFNQSGSIITTYQGNAAGANKDTFNITDGSFDTLKTSVTGTTEVNFNRDYILNGAIVGSQANTLNINVNSGATVTANAIISGLSGDLKVLQGGSLLPNSTMRTIGAGHIDNEGFIKVSATPVFDLATGTGAFSNKGMLELDSSGILSIKGGNTADVFRNEAGSYLNIDINGDKYGQMMLDSTAKEAVLLSDLSSINPIVTGELTGKEFDIITVTGGGKINDAGVQIINDRPDLSFSTRLMKDNTILQLFLDDAPTDCIVNTHRVDLLQTSLCPDFTITVESTGQIENKDKKSAVLLLDNDAGKIVIDADNDEYGARAVLATFNWTGTPTTGIHITENAQGGEVSIGENSGITAESGTVNAHGIVVDGTDATITNAGLIQLKSINENSHNAMAIYVAATGSVTINNSGEISNKGNYTTPLIAVAPGGQLLGTAGLTNNGKITHNAANGKAIDLSQAVRGAFLQQQEGEKSEIRGDVFLAQGDGEGNGYVFTLEGGTITGNVTAANTQSYTHELAGGSLNGTFTGGVKGDFFNQHASKVSTFQGNATAGYTDTFNIEGGSFSTIRTSTVGTTDVNFKADFAGNGSIVGSEGNTLNINVGSEEFTPLSLTLNNTISGLSGALTVYEDNTFSAREKITTSGSGHIVNQGITRISKPIEFDFSSGGTFNNENTGILDLGKDIITIKAAATDAFIAEADSIIKFTIDTEKYGQMNIETTHPGEAVLLKKNSFIQPSVTKQDEANTFDIITVSDPGRITDEGVEVINPEGYTFDKQLLNEGKTLQLIMRTTFFEQLDQLATQSAVDKRMQPLPDHNGLIQGAKQGMNEVFNVVSDRILGVAQGSHYRDETNQRGMWLRALGSHRKQGIREGVSGYKAEGVGFALGTDFVYNDDNTLGFAVNYYKTNVDGENQFSAQDGNILNLQATLYGSIHFEHGIFLNGIVAGSANDYQRNRVIAVNDLMTQARGTFGGMQWGGQVDLGMTMVDSGDNFIAPFVSVKSMFLSFDRYTETGAGDLGLSINNSHVSEWMGGVGLKLSTVWQLGKLGYAPTLTALMGYDFVNDRQSSTAHFIGGGPVFSTPSAKSAPMLFDLGVGLNVLSDKEMVFSVKYDMQMRDKFLSNAGYVQYSYQWS